MSATDLHMDAHRSIPIRRPGAEPLTDAITGGGLAWGPARSRELGAVGSTPNAVARVIEDLQRSGYRPLHAGLAASEPSSIPRARAASGREV